MTDEDLEDRLAAVERRLNAAYPEPQDGVDEERVESMAERLADVEAAVEAIEGYVGAIEREDEELERRADAALAATDDLAERVAELEARVGRARERAVDASERTTGAGIRSPAADDGAVATADRPAATDDDPPTADDGGSTATVDARSPPPTAAAPVAEQPAAAADVDSASTSRDDGWTDEFWADESSAAWETGEDAGGEPRRREEHGDFGGRPSDESTVGDAPLDSTVTSASDAFDDRSGAGDRGAPPRRDGAGVADERCAAQRRAPGRDDPVSGWGTSSEATAHDDPRRTDSRDRPSNQRDHAETDDWTSTDGGDEPGQTLFERLRELL